MSQLKEYDLDFEGVSVHVYRGGAGQPLVLLHGSGAGVSTYSNFKAVLPRLTAEFDVLAADLVGFGKSGRRVRKPYFDMDMWVRQARFLTDQYPGRRVGLVGHSLSGSIVLKAAMDNDRVKGVLTTGTTGWRYDAREMGARWRFPENREAIRRNVERTLFDKRLADDAEIERRAAIVYSPGYKEYFESMFSGDREQYIDASALTTNDLQRISCPVVLMHGRNDVSFAPEDTSLPLGRALPNADVHVLANCAHSVALEHPQKFLMVVRQLFARDFAGC